MNKKQNIFLAWIMLFFISLFTVTEVSAGEFEPLTISTYAGSGEFSNQDGEVDKGSFRFPSYGVIDSKGTVYISDSQNHSIRSITDGVITTVVGKTSGFDSYGMPKGGYKDGKASEAMFQNPKGLAVAEDGSIFVVDSGNDAIRKISLDGTVSTVIENLYGPTDIAIGENGSIYVTDTLNNRIIKIVGNKFEVLAGGNYQKENGWIVGGYKDGKGLEAQFNEPTGIAIDNNGNLVIADSGNQRIRLLKKDGQVTTIAGSGNEKIVGTSYIQGNDRNGKALFAAFNFPKGVEVGKDGTIYVADTYNHKLKIITPAGIVETVAGTGNNGRVNGIESVALFDGLTDVILNGKGDILVIDKYNSMIRIISKVPIPVVANNKVLWLSQKEKTIKNDLGYELVYEEKEGILQLLKDNTSLLTFPSNTTNKITMKDIMFLRLVSSTFSIKITWVEAQGLWMVRD